MSSLSLLWPSNIHILFEIVSFLSVTYTITRFGQCVCGFQSNYRSILSIDGNGFKTPERGIVVLGVIRMFTVMLSSLFFHFARAYGFLFRLGSYGRSHSLRFY